MDSVADTGAKPHPTQEIPQEMSRTEGMHPRSVSAFYRAPVWLSGRCRSSELPLHQEDRAKPRDVEIIRNCFRDLSPGKQNSRQKEENMINPRS
jgi:hypothetical protein